MAPQQLRRPGVFLVNRTPRVFLLLGLYAVGLALFAVLAVGLGHLLVVLAR